MLFRDRPQATPAQGRCHRKSENVLLLNLSFAVGTMRPNPFGAVSPWDRLISRRKKAWLRQEKYF